MDYNNQKINRLEDVVVWQEARVLMRMIYEATKEYPPEEKYNIVKHMRECSRNIPGNIGEGFGRFHYQESMQFYRIARGSLNELKSDTYCSIDCGYIDNKKFDELFFQIEKVARLLNGFINSAQKAKSERATNNK